MFFFKFLLIVQIHKIHRQMNTAMITEITTITETNTMEKGQILVNIFFENFV